RQLARRRRDVVPRRERPPGSTDDNDVHVRVAVRRPQRVPQLLLHLPRDRVELIGAVQRDAGLPAVRLVKNRRIFHWTLPARPPECSPVPLGAEAVAPATASL